jgi:hypothetical protein
MAAVADSLAPKSFDARRRFGKGGLASAAYDRRADGAMATGFAAEAAANRLAANAVDSLGA